MSDTISQGELKYTYISSELKSQLVNKFNEIKDVNSRFNNPCNEFRHPLTNDSIKEDDMLSLVDCILSGNMTCHSSGKVRHFEFAFAEYVGSRYAIMVNSGSSANLLMVAALWHNMVNKGQINRGIHHYILVPTICWSTTIHPIIQYGFSIIFVPIDPYTANIDLNQLHRTIIEYKSKGYSIAGLMLVHALGNCVQMDSLMSILSMYDIPLLEDACEALGSTYKSRFLGTYGLCGSYSFYYSHHMTTIEGGMIVCNSFETYKLLQCMRDHGWSRSIDYINGDNMRYNRNLSHSSTLVEQNHNKFKFIEIGYNLRPTALQAAIGLSQIKKLPQMNYNRRFNYARLYSRLYNNPIFYIIRSSDIYVNAAWFGLAIVKYCNDNVISMEKYLEHLKNNNVEYRPIISGDMTKQLVVQKYKMYFANCNQEFPSSQMLHYNGLFIGLHDYEYTNEYIDKLSSILLCNQV